MGLLFHILTYSLGNLFLGIIFTTVGIALMFFLIRSWYANSSFTPLSLIVGALLFLFLSFQSVLLCGAFTIKTYCDDIESMVDGWMRQLPADDNPLNKESSQYLLECIQSEYPLVSDFIDGANFTGHTLATIAHAISSEMRSYMNRYMWRRVGWGVLFVFTGALLVIKSMERTRSKRRTGGSGGRSRSSSAGSGRRRRYDY